MTRTPQVEQETIDYGYANLKRTTVLLIGGSTYLDLEDLNGPSVDMESMYSLFVDDHNVSLFESSQVIELENPTSYDFRMAITKYARGRSAGGDILILYFSGHGCILPNSTFGFCFRNTRINGLRNGILPISAASITPVIQTLSAVDVHPVFILDACFSGVTAPSGFGGATNTLDISLRNSHADSYALISSSSSQVFSIDAPSGGPFTQALYTIVLQGLSGKTGKRFPFITLNQLATPLQEELAKSGAPLSRCYVGQSLPLIPIAKNVKFSPRKESFTGYMKAIIELLWKNGNPQEVTVRDFNILISPAAYANHSKLSLPPWDLVENAGSRKKRKLTPRGVQFAQGKLQIPRRIYVDHISGQWISDPSSKQIKITDVA